MNEEGIEVSARPILVLTCFYLSLALANWRAADIECSTHLQCACYSFCPDKAVCCLCQSHSVLSTKEYFFQIDFFEQHNMFLEFCLLFWIIWDENICHFFVIPISKHEKKGILTLVISGCSMLNIRDRYGHVYIFLIRKQN